MTHLLTWLACHLLLAGPVLATDFIPLTEVGRGMKGYGLTVFEDSRVDTFQVEVIGVQKGVRADGSLILIEVSGHGLEHSSIAQGMSGSPIFLEGRFAGALAFGWGGALRPLAGVTPAREILNLPTWTLADNQPSARGNSLQTLSSLVPVGGGMDLAGDLWSGGQTATASSWAEDGPRWPRPEDLIVRLLRETLGEAARPRAGADSPWMLRPLGAVGVAGESVAAGGLGADAPGTLEPGSACAIPLVMGDALLGAIGTVTWVDGRDVFMMGHPFMQRGPVRLPLATAQIHTVFPSRQISFKLGSIGQLVGTVNHDQRAGLTGHLGSVPAMIPVKVAWDLPGAEGTPEDYRYQFEVADDAQLAGPLVFWTLYNSLLVAGDDASRQNVAYEIALEWESVAGEPLPPVHLSGVTAGPGGVARLATEWMAPINAMLNNPFVAGRLTSVKARLEATRPIKAARIAGFTVPRALATDAGKIAAKVELAPWQGEPFLVDVELPLPADLPAGNYRLAVASAAEMFALEAQRAPGSLQARSLEQLTDILGKERSAATLMVALFSPGKGLMLDSQEWTGLPGRVSRLLKKGNMEIKPVMADVMAQNSQNTEWLLLGHAVRNIKVAPGPEIAPQKRRP